MAPLPIFFGHLESSLYAAMLFPRHSERAKACAGWWIMRGVINMRERGLGDRVAPTENELLLDVACAAADFAYIYNDAVTSAVEGARAGIVVACLWAMVCSSRETASLEGAIQIAEQYTAHCNRKLPASRARFYECLSQFKPVLHLLGARTLRRQPGQVINVLGEMVDFTPDPSAYRSDVLSFVGEAKDLQTRLRSWEKGRVQSGTMLDELFDLSQTVQPGRGQVKKVALDPWIKIVKGRPGRPRKTPS
jgi:hypothetical protein